MRKTVAILAVVLALAGCGSGATTAPASSSAPTPTVTSNAKLFAAEAAASVGKIEALRADIAKSCGVPESGGVLGDAQVITCSMILGRAEAEGGIVAKAMRGIGGPSPDISDAVAKVQRAAQRLSDVTVKSCSTKSTASTWLMDCSGPRRDVDMAAADLLDALARLKTLA